jgi:hypothetical protein
MIPFETCCYIILGITTVVFGFGVWGYIDSEKHRKKAERIYKS